MVRADVGVVVQLIVCILVLRVHLQVVRQGGIILIIALIADIL